MTHSNKNDKTAMIEEALQQLEKEKSLPERLKDASRGSLDSLIEERPPRK